MRNSKGHFIKGIIPHNKGKKTSIETRKKLSESHKGQKAWNKGLKYSAKKRVKRINKFCKFCNESFQVVPHLKHRKFCNRDCTYEFLKTRKGENHPNYKGFITDKRGYIYLRNPKHPFCGSKGYIKRSRFNAEQRLNRYLTKHEVIHHINGILDDDRIENLYLFPNQSEHMSYHLGVKFNNYNKIIKSNFV